MIETSLPIILIGNGRDKKTNFNSTKRVKSSKLNPIKQESKALDPLDESAIVGNKTQNLSKKSFIRSKPSFPKLLKKTVPDNMLTMTENEKPVENLANINQKDYLSRFSRVHDLDKEK